MNQKMTYYEILQVTDDARDEVIHMVSKALMKKYHPDVFKGDPKFAEEKTKDKRSIRGFV